jgi:pantetheine-phosphate adenylyltransferase
MSKPKIAFSGSFDPPTLGHIDIIKRLSKNFDVYVIIAKNEAKKNMFSADERQNLLLQCLKQENMFQGVNVIACPEGILLVDFLKELNIHLIARGVRESYDLVAEMTMANINLEQSNDEIETVLFCASPEYSHISSSAVKTLALYPNGNISKMVPPIVHKAIYNKLK